MLDARNQDLFQGRLHSIWWCWDLSCFPLWRKSLHFWNDKCHVRSVCKILILLNCQPIKNNKLWSSAPVPPHRSHFAWHASWKDFPPFHVRSANGLLSGLRLVVMVFYEVSFCLFRIGKNHHLWVATLNFGSVIHKHVNIFYTWYCLTNKYIHDHPIVIQWPFWDGDH